MKQKVDIKSKHLSKNQVKFKNQVMKQIGNLASLHSAVVGQK